MTGPDDRGAAHGRDGEAERTVVHLLRHGEVDNPTGVLYGRMPGFALSDRGRRMARRVAGVVAEGDVTRVVASPLQRAQETAGPVADECGLDVVTDERLIESENRFEGQRFGRGSRTLLKPSVWRHLYNPLRPSWGEPYREVVARMMAAVEDARDAAAGHEVVLVSHQLPIWVTRLHAEGRRRYLHDPRLRKCAICSLTSLHFEGQALAGLTYSEPAADLVPGPDRNAPFSSGGAEPEAAS